MMPSEGQPPVRRDGYRSTRVTVVAGLLFAGVPMEDGTAVAREPSMTDVAAWQLCGICLACRASCSRVSCLCSQ